ncbi:hypothetical protein BJF79_26725 [Actinomadura sp. CNU-125]|nr:hypothetical protein BJF79_26725 [Actinomadura sp. CNU-125]
MIDDRPQVGADVRQRYQKAMRLRVHHLTGRVLDSLKQAEHAYRSSGTIPSQEPPQWIARSIDRALDAVTLPSPEIPATLDMPHRTGTRRGRQGVPERALLRAYHLGGRELSLASTQWAMEEGLDHRDVALLIDAIWRVTEEHSAAAVTALRGARDEIVEPRRAGHLLDALLNGDDEGRTVAAVARSFAVPESGRYAVVVRHPVHGGVREEDLVPWAKGTRLVWRRHGVTAVGVAVLGTAGPTSLAGALHGVGGYRTGVSGALEGLASLGRARQGAEAAARTPAPGRAWRSWRSGSRRRCCTPTPGWRGSCRRRCSGRCWRWTRAAGTRCWRRWRRGCARAARRAGSPTTCSATATRCRTGCGGWRS